ncbi:MAG: outer membrane beta-barrel protein [Pseudomonadota bacterium]
MSRNHLLGGLAAAGLTLLVADAQAQTGFYVGGGVGISDQEVTLDAVGELTQIALDDGQEFAWKVFAGINLDVPFINLGVEGGYVDLGSPQSAVPGASQASVDSSGFDAFGVVAVDVGPLSIFGKVGLIAWDLDVSTTPPALDVGESGTNFAGGVGAQFRIGRLQLRGEYEYFDISEVDDSFLLSTSLLWSF